MTSVGPWFRLADRGALEESVRQPATAANTVTERGFDDVLAIDLNVDDASLSENMVGRRWWSEVKMCK